MSIHLYTLSPSKREYSSYAVNVASARQFLKSKGVQSLLGEHEHLYVSYPLEDVNPEYNVRIHPSGETVASRIARKISSHEELKVRRQTVRRVLADMHYDSASQT